MPPNQKKSEVRKEQIQKAAVKVFARKSLMDATIADIAQETGVSEATIYEYFSTKEELLFSIPCDIIVESKKTLEFHLAYVRGSANKLRSFIYHMMLFYQENPDYASVALKILKTNEKYMQTETYQVLRDLVNLIITIVNDGIKMGEFKPDTNPYLVRSVLLGSIEHMVIRWILLGCPQEKKTLIDMVDPLFDLIIGGIQADQAAKGMHFKIHLEPLE